MDTYMVGGAVRDTLLGLEVHERDWVVVGSTPQAMLDAGFRQVGKDFPVFLHPKTQEEYALARTERKTAGGYQGFEFDTASSVTLEEDLSRRDLTVNAIAEQPDGTLVDPYGGQADIKARKLRHVSDAFVEDPVRVLRIARFAARFHKLGFTVADETLALMRSMVVSGEVDHLQADRVWRETERALLLPEPQVFFEVLRSCDALERLFPWIDALFGVPQTERWHPEIDTGIHTLMVLKQSALLSPDLAVRFAALTHDLGKAETPKDVLPGHRGHEARSLPLLRAWCERYPVSKQCRDLSLLVAELHGKVHREEELRSKTVLGLFEATDAFRRPERFEHFLLACEADARGRLGLELDPYPQADKLRAAFRAANKVTARDLLAQGIEGPALGEAITKERLKAIKSVRLG
ncbi:MAG: multifunctional CCA addition/repair protein [Pseudomonadota bacterium]